jgi:WD40 repeat protein/tRNA A-37 threonylcarbamoyl transferase component Bud32
MSDTPKISELLLRWQELRQQGRTLEPVELCRDCPELMPEVARQLAALQAVHGVVENRDTPTPATQAVTLPAAGPGAGQAARDNGEAATLPPPANAPGTRLDASVGADPWATDPATAPTIAAASRALSCVPGYEILSVLGRGGMGVVYKARQVKLDRLVALKMVLAGGHAGVEELARFRSEAEAVARLQHPNIVQIHEVGDCAGQPFFSLEFCSGGSLADQLDGTPWAPGRAAGLVETLARAMDAAHQRGVVHRDLKPANVLMTADGQPKVTDFGLAKRLDQGQGQTCTGAVMGTPSYMAPEQAGGKAREVGPAADVYALGAILYEVLTGRPPFKGPTPLDTVLMVVGEEPVAPRQLQPRVPRDLETVCLKCLDKLPRKRYTTAGVLAEDLRRFQAGEPITARRIGITERGLKWVRRKPGVAALLAVIVAVTLTSIGLLTWQLTRVAAALTQARDNLYQGQVALADSEVAAGNLRQARQILLQSEPERRANWEWRYLLRRSEASHFTLRERGLRITQLAFRPQNKELVGCIERTGEEGRLTESAVKVWEVASRRELSTLKGDGMAGWQLSPDGAWLASIQGDTLWRLDLRTGEKSAVALRGRVGPQGQVDQVLDFAFNSDASRLAVAECWDGLDGGKRGRVRVWELRSGKVVTTLENQHRAFAGVTFSPEDTLVATVDYCGEIPPGVRPAVRLWHTTGRMVRELSGEPGDDLGMSYSRDGTRVALSHWVNGAAWVDVWDPTKGKRLVKLPESGALIGFLPDSRRLATAMGDRLLIWDTRGGQLLRSLPGHTGRVRGVGVLGGRCAAISPDGEHLATSSFYGDRDTRYPWGELKVWDDQSGLPARTLRGHGNEVLSLAFSPDGGRLISGSGDKTVRHWDRYSGRTLQTLRGHSDRIPGVAYSRDARLLASAGWDGVLRVWEAATARAVRALSQVHGTQANTVSFSPDNQRLASGGLDCVVRIWDLNSGQQALACKGHTTDVLQVTFSPEGGRLASISRRELKVWDTQTGMELVSISGKVNGLYGVQVDGICGVAWSPTGDRLALAKRDGSVTVLDGRTGEANFTVRGDTDQALCVAFSPDGRRLASGGADQMVRLWDAGSGHQLLTLRGHTKEVLCLAFSPDGSCLASGSADGTIKLWDALPRDADTDPRASAGNPEPAPGGPSAARGADEGDDPLHTLVNAFRASAAEDGTVEKQFWGGAVILLLLIMAAVTAPLLPRPHTARWRRFRVAGWLLLSMAVLLWVRFVVLEFGSPRRSHYWDLGLAVAASAALLVVRYVCAAERRKYRKASSPQPALTSDPAGNGTV